MNVKNLFKIEEVLELSDNKYFHISPFVGSVDVDIMLGGIKEDKSDECVKAWYYTNLQDMPIMIIPIEF